MVESKSTKQGILSSIGEFAFLLFIVFLIRTFGFGLYQVPTGSMEKTLLVGERFFADKFTYLFRAPRKGEIIAFNDPTYKYSTGRLSRLFEDYVWGPSNWTKRVVGVPGDVVRGAIENGKPVVYVNDTKIDEPYLNEYPLIHMWKADPAAIKEDVQRQLASVVQGRSVDSVFFDKLLSQKMAAEYTTWKSYDPDKTFEEQPFYRLEKNRLYPTAQGPAELLNPGTVLASKEGAEQVVEHKRNYWDGSDIFYVKLARNKYWLMGDNRLGSKDCRFLGPISKSLIHGRIILRIWSLDSDEPWWILDLLKHPIDFWQRVRWNRFFQWV